MVPKTFVVPLDGSPFAERALPVARAIAARVGGRLRLVSAPYKGPIGPKEYLAEVAGRIGDVPVETIASDEYLPADAILAAVTDADDGIVCMTSHGRGGLRWSMLGSTAEDVVRRSDRAVVLVGGRCRDDFLATGTHLLVVVDVPDNTEPIAHLAREWAAELKLQLDSATVVHPLDVESAEHPEQLLDPIVERFGGADAVNAMLLSSSYPAGAIADCADDLPAALIAMNSYGRTGLARFVLGSVTMTVLHLAGCPLLVTHSPS